MRPKVSKADLVTTWHDRCAFPLYAAASWWERDSTGSAWVTCQKGKEEEEEGRKGGGEVLQDVLW